MQVITSVPRNRGSNTTECPHGRIFPNRPTVATSPILKTAQIYKCTDGDRAGRTALSKGLEPRPLTVADKNKLT